MKVGDLVKPKGRTTGDTGIIVEIATHGRWTMLFVLFHDGVFDVRMRDVEVIK